ncbi:MAG TPA: hypothetical protein VL285_08245 [Bryobacteraceae bacterium]|nr:hypothetical protein [Bryobacteraceae bacterium]
MTENMARGAIGSSVLGARKWELPPLILHPFSDQSGPGKLVQSSRASLMLNGLLPNDESTEDELTRKLLEGRICEIRMLFFVGKDLMRWVAQCLDFVSSIPQLKDAGICEQSFAEFLVQNPPEPVRAKLRGWGVFDYKSIFSRAIGLNAVFSSPPDETQVSSEFIRNYFRYADHMFACRQQMQAFTEVTVENFQFEIYASGEYSRLLEKSWEE